MADSTHEAVRIGLLGGFGVSVGSRTIGQAEWPLRKAANLLKLLALARGHRLHREQVTDALWPDAARKAAAGSLRRTLHSARKVLDPDAGFRYLASENEQLVLCPDASLWVDVEAFEEAAAAARHSRDPAAYRAARDLYAGELLPGDRYEEWAEEKRRGLGRLYLDLLVELAQAYEERAEPGRAIEALREAVAREPALEGAHAGLMRLYALLGREGEALAQYERLRVTLSKEPGLGPGTATRQLRDEIASGEFPSTLSSLSVAPQEERPPRSSGHNLPAPRTSFVGREREMLEVKRALAMTRLMTVTGTGGSGKTRLALEVAGSLVGAYPDGVWLVELAPLSEGAPVPQAVAQALGVRERSGDQLTDTLAEVLRTKRTLLVLDNCEHVVEAVAELVDVLLDSCPGVRVLATSREPLGIAGEMKWQVSPLSVPDLRRVLTAGELESYESVRLFVERARYRNPAFALTPQNTQAVARICERLDGIPLAIELAAARVELSVEQIATLLDDSLKLLTTGSRTASARQRTLRGALDWSYDLLSEPERVLFARLSVFAGGWTLEAAEAVASGEGVEEDGVLDLLSNLVNKSLIVAEATGKGRVRYRMLEPVRQYSSKHLEESGEVEAIRRAHAGFFLALAEESYPELKGANQLQWLEHLEAEHDNMRATLSWALEHREAEVALRLGGALGWFWEMRGYHSEGRRWLEEALAMDGRGSPVSRAMALAGVGWLALQQGDYDRAQEACEEGLQLLAHGEAREAKLDLLACLGWVAQKREEHGQAKQSFEESLTLSREMRDTWWLANSLSNMALVSSSLGDSERATELYEESMGLFRKQGDKQSLAQALNQLGMLMFSKGDLGRAAQLTEEAVALHRELGVRVGVATGLYNLGWLALLQDDLGRARDLYSESLSLSWYAGLNPIVQCALEGFACVAGAKKEPERAARLWGATQALHETKGIPRDIDFLAEADARIAALRSGMGEQAWGEAQAEGKAMELEQAVEYALSAGGSPKMAKRPPEQTPATARPPALTRREREVAELVARGLTNRRIAEELFLSERTVDHHVSNILKKENLSSREQVASLLGDH
jgi:predicted ATPase/DNA-binding SARP family transcriptional activator/DNA-binding CsgD family transcriptional regulator